MISNLSQVMAASLSQLRDSTPVATPVAPPSSGDNVVPLQGSTPAENSGSAQTSTTPGRSRGPDPALDAAIEKLNSKVQNLNRNLEFSLDKDSGELVVKVVDANTHEVISQIPRQEALKLAQCIEQYMQDHHIGLVQAKA
jgi:flagellar protein FlaG